MNTDYQECLAVAERAAEWVVRLPDATLAERREFTAWLRDSPLNVREFLLAASCKELLERLVTESSLSSASAQGPCDLASARDPAA